MNIFRIDPIIERAETLSSEFYLSDKHFEISKEKIFARSWQLIGRKEDAGNISPKVFLEGYLDEPIVLTRDSDGRICCLSNVCTHRGKILVESSCRADALKCGYHGRIFSLDGRFRSMPEFENVENFPDPKDDLKNVPFAIWQNFIFASLVPYAPFEAFIPEMDFAARVFDHQDPVRIIEKDYVIDSHWALYCENYLEGFHIPFVHKDLNRELDFGTYKTELFDLSSVQTGYDANGEIAARYFFVFPNLMFNFYPWGISVNIVKPISKDRTKVSYIMLVFDESKTDSGAGGDLERVEYEDQAVVESVQRGIRSRFYDRGRYSPSREQGTHHFHRLICDFMSN
ncbi:MAG: SRPBCC family protein [Pyrinomonadaceae bacterium]